MKILSTLSILLQVLLIDFLLKGFESKEDLGAVFEEPPLATLPMNPIAPVVNLFISFASTAVVVTVTTPAIVSREKAGPFNRRRGMKQVLIEVPDGGNLLKKSGRVVV